MTEAIINNRVAGTRITVWDVLHYWEHGWANQEIAHTLGLSLQQVQAVIEYIHAHRDEVMAVHRQIEEKIARGNPPDIEARLAENRAKIRQWKQDQEVQEPESARNRGGR